MMLYSRWCALSLPTRNKLAEAFGIVKKGSTEVSSNVVRHDGYLVEDIEKAMTSKAMEEFLGLTFPDAEILWNAVVDRIEGREVEGGTPISQMSVLPAKEAKQFKKEYKARVKANVKKVKSSVVKVKKTSTKKKK